MAGMGTDASESVDYPLSFGCGKSRKDIRYSSLNGDGMEPERKTRGSIRALGSKLSSRVQSSDGR